MVPVELKPFPAAVLIDLAQQLGIPGLTPQLHIELQLIADAYRTQAGTAKTERSARRKRMKALAKGLRSALDAHEAIESGDLLDMVRASPDATYDDLMMLTSQLRKWTPVIEGLACGRLPRGPEESASLVHCCERLRMIYEDVTGHEASHTSLRGIEETSAPQSRFGKFVSAFFRHVDPGLVRSLNEALRKVVWSSREKKAVPGKSG